MTKEQKITEATYEWENNKYESLLVPRSFTRYKKIIKRLCAYYKVPQIPVRRIKATECHINPYQYIIDLGTHATVLHVIHEFTHYYQDLINFPKQHGFKYPHGKRFRRLLDSVIITFRQEKM